jgi:hypothetical protein
LCNSISTGRDIFDWTSHAALKCLYFDGEMPGDDMKARLIGMSPNPNCINDNLLTLNHEVVFDKTGLSMNLADPRWQDEITNVGVTLSGFLGVWLAVFGDDVLSTAIAILLVANLLLSAVVSFLKIREIKRK